MDDQIRWFEYKASLADIDPRKLRDANVSCKLSFYDHLSLLSICKLFSFSDSGELKLSHNPSDFSSGLILKKTMI